MSRNNHPRRPLQERYRQASIAAVEILEDRSLLSADLTILNMFDNQGGIYTPGVPIQYTIVLQNQGTTSISGAQVTESIPAGVNYSKTVRQNLKSSSSGGAASVLGVGGGMYQNSGSAIVWNLPTLIAGQQVAVSAIMVPTTSAGTVTDSSGNQTQINTITTTATLTTTPDTANSPNATLSVSLTDYYQQAANRTTITVGSSGSPSAVGTSVTFTATVSKGGVNTTPTGTVQFYNENRLLGSAVVDNGTATYSTSNLAVGTYSITASYDGDSNYQPSTSNVMSQSVQASLPVNTPVAMNTYLTMTITAVAGATINPSQYIPGTNLSYLFTVNNTGAQVMGLTTVTYACPTGYSVVNYNVNTVEDTVTVSSSTVVFNLSNLAQGTTSMSVTIYAAPPSPITSYTGTNANYVNTVPPFSGYGSVTGPAPLGGSNGVVAPVAAPVLAVPAGDTNTGNTSPSLTIPVPAYIVSMTDNINLPAITPSVYSYYATDGQPTATNPPVGAFCVAYSLRQLVNYWDDYENVTANGTNGAFNINLNGGTYTFASSGSSKSNDQSYQLVVNNPNGLGNGRALQISNGTINANYASRAFRVAFGQTLYLNDVVIENGQENGGTNRVSGNSYKDAFGGGIYVSGGGRLFLQQSTIKNCLVQGNTGTGVTAAVKPTQTTRQGVGYNAAGGGIYGAAGSTISVDGQSVLTGNTVIGGKGGSVNNTKLSRGGTGGSAYGGAIAIDAPESGSGSTSSQTQGSSASSLTIAGGAVIQNNRLNRTQNVAGTKTTTRGGTGGADTGGTAGTGGNAYGAGIYMYSGNLVLNGGSKNQAIAVSGNLQSAGKPGTSGTLGAAGTSAGVLYLQPGQVSVTNSPPASGLVGSYYSLSAGASLIQPAARSNSSWLGNQTPAATTLLVGPIDFPNIQTNGFADSAGNPAYYNPVNGNNTNVEARWYGEILIPGIGTTNRPINFATTSDDGSMLYIDGYPVVYNNYSQGATQRTRLVYLTPGLHTIDVEYYQGGSAASMKVQWDTTGRDNFVDIPNSAFSYNPTTYNPTYNPANGMITFQNNATVTSQGQSTADLFLPTPLTTIDDAAVSGTGLWNLRTAVAAANALATSGTAITLNLTSGTYTLSRGSLQVTTTGIGSLTLVGNSNGTGSTATIISGNHNSAVGSIFHITKASVTLSKLTLENGNATSTSPNGPNGGAIAATNTQAGQVVSLNNVSVLNSTSANNGGGIYQSGGTLILTASTIHANRAAAGGGVYANNSHVTLNQTSVNSNTATEWGGAAYLNSSTFTMPGGTLNSNTASGNAGAIYASGSSSTPISLSGVTVSGNTATGGVGGGICGKYVPVTLTNCTFTQNAGANNGGAVYVNGTSVLNIVGGTYGGTSTGSGNSAYCGGAIAASSFGGANPTVNISAASISGNNARQAGGGIYQSAGKLSITNNSKIDSNSATNDAGGAIYLTNNSTRFTMTGGSLNRNTAGVYGGAIYCTSPSATLSEVTVSGNHGGNAGGAICASNVALTLSNCTFTSNSSNRNGGAVFTNGSTKLKVSGGSYGQSGSGNSAVGYGGAIAASGSKTVSISGANITGNSATTSGGGIYQSKGTLNFHGSVTINNNNVSLSSGQTGNGGGIAVQNATLNVASSTSLNLQENKVTTSSSGVTGTGGAIYFGANSIYTLNGTVSFDGNTGVSGGNDYAFVVPKVADGTSSPSGFATGIAYFTGGTGSLRSAVAYCQKYMTSSVNSMAIVLTSAGTTTTQTPSSTQTNYILSYYGTSGGSNNTLSFAVPSSLSLAIVGEAGSGAKATIQGWYAQSLSINDSGSLYLQNLIVNGGRAVNQQGGNGGGIYQNNGTTTLNNVLVTKNSAGYTGVAANGANSAGSFKSNSHARSGANGTPGSSGYGGGIYLGGGTLSIGAGTSITGNTVYGQSGGNGGNGQNGSCSAHVHGAFNSKCDDTKRTKGGNGGNGGNGGVAEGGGLYQAGGTIDLPSGDTIGNFVSGNSAYPGKGGNGGYGGSGASWNSHGFHRSSLPGANGYGGNTTNGTFTGLGATGVSNFGHNGNSCIYYGATPSFSAGLYSFSGGLNTSSGPQAPIATSSGLNTGLPGIVVELFSQNGTRIAQATSDQNGRFHFVTNWSGLGYIQIVTTPIFSVAPLGTSIDSEHASSMNPSSGRSNVVQFLDGVAVNANLNVLLQAKATTLITGQNKIQLRDSQDKTLWVDQLMPANYRGGFTITQFDLSGDNTSEYIVTTKTGPTMLFIVDGRTGAVTRVDPAIRFVPLLRGIDFVAAGAAGNGARQFLFVPKDGKGNIAMVSPSTGKVLWTAPGLPVESDVRLVSSQVPGQAEKSDVLLTSIKLPKGKLPEVTKRLNIQTGQIRPSR